MLFAQKELAGPSPALRSGLLDIRALPSEDVGALRVPVGRLQDVQIACVHLKRELKRD